MLSSTREARSSLERGRLIRRPEVEHRTGLSRSEIYRRVQERIFPAPVKLGGQRAVGWVEADIDRWIAARVAEARAA